VFAVAERVLELGEERGAVQLKVPALSDRHGPRGSAQRRPGSKTKARRRTCFVFPAGLLNIWAIVAPTIATVDAATTSGLAGASALR